MPGPSPAAPLRPPAAAPAAASPGGRVGRRGGGSKENGVENGVRTIKMCMADALNIFFALWLTKISSVSAAASYLLLGGSDGIAQGGQGFGVPVTLLRPVKVKVDGDGGRGIVRRTAVRAGARSRVRQCDPR